MSSEVTCTGRSCKVNKLGVIYKFYPTGTHMTTMEAVSSVIAQKHICKSENLYALVKLTCKGKCRQTPKNNISTRSYDPRA